MYIVDLNTYKTKHLNQKRSLPKNYIYISSLCTHSSMHTSQYNTAHEIKTVKHTKYLITWNFRDTFISRFCYAHVSRRLNSAISRKFCTLNILISRFRVTHNFFLWQCYFNVSLNLVNRLHHLNNTSELTKKAKAGLYVNSNIMWVT